MLNSFYELSYGRSSGGLPQLVRLSFSRNYSQKTRVSSAVKSFRWFCWSSFSHREKNDKRKMMNYCISTYNSVKYIVSEYMWITRINSRITYRTYKKNLKRFLKRGSVFPVVFCLFVVVCCGSFSLPSKKRPEICIRMMFLLVSASLLV